MLEVWKSLLNSEADGPHGHAVGEQNIADDVPPHQPLALFLPGKKGCGVHGHAVRPRQEGVLAPPPRHYQGHIEPKYKCEGDGGQLLMAVGAQGLKQLTGLLPLKEGSLSWSEFVKKHLIVNSQQDKDRQKKVESCTFL